MIIEIVAIDIIGARAVPQGVPFAQGASLACGGIIDCAPVVVADAIILGRIYFGMALKSGSFVREFGPFTTVRWTIPLDLLGVFLECLGIVAAGRLVVACGAVVDAKPMNTRAFVGFLIEIAAWLGRPPPRRLR